MLSNPASAIENWRKAHRRQNSTPNIGTGQLKKLPAVAQLQRASSQRGGLPPRGHRRGLSLDQPRLHIPSKLTPSLGPISQDDLSVSIGTNHTGSLQYGKNPLQSNLHRNFYNHESMYASPLALQTQNFALPIQHSVQSFTPLRIISPTHTYTASPVTQSPANPSQQFMSQQQPTPQQLNALSEHIKSLYGHMGEVHINILPSPVATPQKRSSVVLMDGIDANRQIHVNSNVPGKDFSLNLHDQNPSREQTYESPYHTPNHSVSCSPNTSTVSSFLSDLAPALFPMNDPMNDPTHQTPRFSSCHTTLLDVELPIADRSNRSSPANSQRAISIADLSLEGTVEDTGITAQEIQQYISEQDPVNNRWRCLFPGCDARTFGRRENIRSHVQTHLGDRQYKCNHCSKRFVRQHDLKRHAKIHSGSKPFKCPCGGGFARQDALTRHRQRGMCVGGFPNAIRKQVRRGRPKKLRPDLEEYLENAARARGCSSSSSIDSVFDNSPSPAPEDYLDGIDSARLVDLPEEDEIDTFGLKIAGMPLCAQDELSFMAVSHSRHQSLHQEAQALDIATSASSASTMFCNPLLFTPPATSPSEFSNTKLLSLDLTTASAMFASSPPVLAGAHRDTPPTSPLILCAPTLREEEEVSCLSPSLSGSSLESMSIAASAVAILNRQDGQMQQSQKQQHHNYTTSSSSQSNIQSLLDDICLTRGATSIESLDDDDLRMSYSSELGAFGLSGYSRNGSVGLKCGGEHDGIVNGVLESDEDRYRMWTLEDNF